MSAPVRRRSAAPAVPGCAVLALAGAVLLLITNVPVGAVLLLAAAGVSLVVGRRKAQQAAERFRIRAAQSMEIDRYHAMKAAEFEHAIAFLCRRDGCTNVRVAGGAGDLGADVVATAPDGRRVVIQCKRYRSTKVGSPDMQRFGGTCYAVHRADVAAVVTTSAFTQPAVNYGAQQGIRLFDSAALAGWATRTGPAPWM